MQIQIHNNFIGLPMDNGVISAAVICLDSKVNLVDWQLPYGVNLLLQESDLHRSGVAIHHLGQVALGMSISYEEAGKGCQQ